jgi:hypothetical protein
VTLAQIVARQRATLAQIHTARGVAVWREDSYSTSSAPPLRLVHFAYTTTGSVNLVVAWDGRSPVGLGREKPDWQKVLAAYLVRDDVVYAVRPAPKSRGGWITGTPFNPAVHERNPIVAFHVDQLADEPVTLADLYATQSAMATQPAIEVVRSGNEEKFVITFTNPAAPGEQLRYLVNPQKGYLNEYIGRYSGGRKIFETSIVVGSTPQGQWIPARRTKYEYAADGRLVRRSEWYFHSLQVNCSVGPEEIGFGYFHLPPEAWPQKVQTNAPPTVTPSRRIP